MKKKVRIYKAPDGQGAFLNKTAKFLKKAQEGGTPDPSMMGYPGAQQEEGQMTEDQITQSIVVDISNGKPKEETVVKLVQFMGQDPMQASQYYDQIYAALESEKEQDEEDADEDSESEPVKEEIEQNENQEIEEDFYGDDTNTDIANEIAAEDDEDYADDDQVASDIVMQFGGVSPVIVPIRQEGGQAYPIQFPGIEAYLPSNMSDMLSGDVDAFTGQPWSPQAEEVAGVAPDDEVQTDFRNGGQYKKNKRSYVNSVMKLVKKQMGGEDMSKKGDTDPNGDDVRKERLNAFLGTVKNQSQMAKAKEQAEQEYDQMMQQQQQMMQQQYPMQEPMEQPMAQYGMQIPMRRGLFGRPKMPRGFGFGYGMPPVTKMDVRRTGIFGRPKEYTMEFGMPAAMPGVALPGYGAGFYGYGQTSTIKKGKSKGRIITETVASTVNNASNAEVASNTPDSTATNKSDDKNSTATTPNSTANNVQVNTQTSNKRKGVNVTNEATDAVVNNSNEKRKETEVVETVKNASSKKQGDGLYSYPGNNAIYKKKDGVWYIDSSGSGANFRKITTDKDARVKRLESKATPYSSKPKPQSYANVYDAPATFGNEGNKYLDISTVKAPANYKAPIAIGSEEWFKLTPVQQKKVADEHRRRNPSEYKKAWNNLKSLPKDVFYEGPKNLYNEAMRQTGGQAYYNPFGGFVDSDNPDLYKFVYGGNDPYMTQADIDDVYSKDTSDPYFQDGGGYDDYRKRVGDKLGMSLRDDLSAKELFEMGQKAGIGFGNDNTTTTTKKKTTTTESDDDGGYYPANPGIGYNGFNIFGNLFPASIASYQGSWNKIKKGPYDPRSGAMIPGMGFGPNTQINSIDVKRSGMFGRPKKYTINFSNQQMDPRKQNLITLPGQGTPGASGYAGQEPAAQQQGDRFSNTKGLKAGTRAKVAMKELFNRYKDEEEEVPTGDVASTSNEPSPSQKPLSDEEEVAKFQQQQRQKGLMIDPETQKWVKAPELKMDIKRPTGFIDKDVQAAADKLALSKEAKESFADYGDISSELGDKNVQSEYQKIYESRGKEAAENFMDDQFRKRNANVRANEPVSSEEQAESLRQDIINNENMASNPMFMGRRTAPQATETEPTLEETGYRGTPSFEEATGMQRFNPEAGQEEEVVEEESFGPVADNPFAPTSADDEAAGFGYDITGKPKTAGSNIPKKKSIAQRYNEGRIKRQEEAANKKKQTLLNKEEKQVDDSRETIMDRINKSTTNLVKPEKKEYWPSDIKNNQGVIKRGTNVRDIGYERAQRSKVARDTDEMKQMTSSVDKSAKERDAKIAEINKRNISPDEKRKLIEVENQRHIDNYAEIEKNYEQKKRFKKNAYMTNESLKLRQFGGDLTRFTGGMQQFPIGGSPITYTDNPALVGMSNVDMISLNEGIPGLQQSSFWGDQASFNAPAPVNPQQQPEEVKMDKAQISSDQAKKEYQATPGDFSMDVKVKDTWQINTPQAINTLNAGITGVAGMINRMKDKKRNAKMYDNLTADNLYASDPSRDRGDYDTNTGLYRPDQQGATHTSRSARYGGMYQDGGQRRSFYNTAISDYNQWLANPKAWQEDPEMLAPDGKNLNLCLDCMDMDYSNEQDIRDAHKLIEEGYSTGTHRNEEAFHKGLKQYGLENPIYASKKQLAQNQFGGYYDEEDDDVAYMTEDQIRQFLANGGEIEYL